MTFDLDIYRVILLLVSVACLGMLVYRQIVAPAPQPAMPGERLTDKAVLLVISVGLIVIILAIINVIYQSASTDKVLPNWAENVFVAIATAAILKLGDCLSTLVNLAGGRQVQRLGEKLGDSQPINIPDPDAPSGTQDDPLHVAGAGSSEPPVRTKAAAK